MPIVSKTVLIAETEKKADNAKYGGILKAIAEGEGWPPLRQCCRRRPHAPPEGLLGRRRRILERPPVPPRRRQGAWRSGEGLKALRPPLGVQDGEG